MSSDHPITSQRRRALLTGGTGFIGSHLVQALLAAGWEVHLLLRPGPCRHSKDVQTHLYWGETSDVIRAMQLSRPDVVFHLASLFLAQHTPEQVLPLLQSNVLLGTQLLEAMRLAGIHFLINTGTCWQYFERDTYSPVNLYAATKQAFEDILASYVEAAGVRAVTLSLFDTYGRGDARKKLLPLLLNSLQNDTMLEMSPGEQLLDLLHVDDLCAAYLQAAELVRDPQYPPGDHLRHQRRTTPNPPRGRFLARRGCRPASAHLLGSKTLPRARSDAALDGNTFARVVSKHRSAHGFPRSARRALSAGVQSATYFCSTGGPEIDTSSALHRVKEATIRKAAE